MLGWGGKGRTNPGPHLSRIWPFSSLCLRLSTPLGREPLPGPVPPSGGVTGRSLWPVVGEGAAGSLAGVTVPPQGSGPRPGVTAPPSGGGAQ